MQIGSREYAARLEGQRARWKVLLDVQAPYRWNLKRLDLGYTLDVGCGIGRNLINLKGVGIDSNEACVQIACNRGLAVYMPHAFQAELESFDSLLFAHVLEHVAQDGAVELVRQYLPYLKPGGRVIMITPQELGFSSDDTHVQFVDFEVLKTIATLLDLEAQQLFSFPFPRWAGQLFKYNEFVLTATKASAPV